MVILKRQSSFVWQKTALTSLSSSSVLRSCLIASSLSSIFIDANEYALHSSDGRTSIPFSTNVPLNISW